MASSVSFNTPADSIDASERRPSTERKGFRGLVQKVKRRIKWWMRDRKWEAWDKQVDEVIRKRQQMDDPIRTTPMTIRFARGTRFKPRTPSIYDPAERERDMGTEHKRRRPVK